MAEKTNKPEPKPIRLAVHPSADIFPLMPDAELDELAASIKKHGLREKLTVDTDGILIDGRNRYAAMKRAGIPLKAEHVTVKNFENTPYSVDEYIVMANIERRMLTQQQRKELAGKLAIRLEEAQAIKPKEQRVDSTKKAAEAAGVSRRTAATAKQETLVQMGLREAPTKQNETKKPTKVDQAPARPPAVIKSLSSIAANIHANGSKWPANRKEQAVKFAMQILSDFATTTVSVGLTDHLSGLLGVPRDDKK